MLASGCLNSGRDVVRLSLGLAGVVELLDGVGVGAANRTSLEDNFVVVEGACLTDRIVLEVEAEGVAKREGVPAASGLRRSVVARLPTVVLGWALECLCV